MSIRPLPTDLPVREGQLQTLLSNLRRSYLRSQDEPFAHPEDTLKILGRLDYIPIRAAERTRANTAFPGGFLSGLTGIKGPVAFVVDSRPEGLQIAAGGLAAGADKIRGAVSAAVGVPPDKSIAPPPRTWVRTHWHCLSGAPAQTNPDHQSQNGPTVIDGLLDGFRRIPFIYIILATPEPDTIARSLLEQALTAQEALDRRIILQSDQPNADPIAETAKELLGAHIKRLQAVLDHGGWRVSILVGSEDEGSTKSIAATLGGLLRGDDGAPSPTPLQGHAVSATRPPTGYPVHHNLLSSWELSRFTALPGRPRLGFSLVSRADFDLAAPRALGGIDLGVVVDRNGPTARSVVIAAETLKRHAFVTGMTGSGKTTTVKRILAGLEAQGIPYLVLEPAKAEYRSLAATSPVLRILAVGGPPSARELPFRLNPFYFPDGFGLQTHIDLLKQAFIASFGFVPPTPYLLEEAIHEVYRRAGWNLATGRHPRGRDRLAFPTLSDLRAVIDEVVERAGYDVEIQRNLRGALRTRIGNLCIGAKGMALDTRDNLPEAALFDGPVVLEFKDIGSDEEKAFLMGLILTRLYEYREAGGPAGAGTGLKHLLVIEEAHRLLRASSERSSENGNMRFQAVETFANMLSEIRAYGQGVLVAEQLPTKVSTDLVKNSGTKLLHRMPPLEDRELVGATMLLDPQQLQEAAILGQGIALLHQEGMEGPTRIQVHPPASTAPVAKRADWRHGLTSDLVERLEASVDRAPIKEALEAETVRRCSDRILTRLSCDDAAKGAPVPDLRGDLSALKDAFTDQAALWSDKARIHALREALERRAVINGWSAPDLDRLAALLSTDLPVFMKRYLEQLDNQPRPWSLCAHCTRPCRFRYEGDKTAATEGYLYALDAVLSSRHSGGDLIDALRSTTEQWAKQVLGSNLAIPPALTLCSLRGGVTHLGLSRATQVALLTAP